MVRNYIRKTDRQKWDENVMKTAIQEIHAGMPFKRAAKIFGLPLTTLKRRAKGENKLATGCSEHLGRYTTTLPIAIETSLREYELEMEDRLFGLTKKDLCKMAYDLAERNGIAHRFSRNKKATGTAWFQGFLSRNAELSFRTPEATSAARARGFNKEAVQKIFKHLDEIKTKCSITDPAQIYNMDEAGIQTVPSKLPKIVAHKGRKQVGYLTSAERGQRVTVVVCVNATGQFIPPAIIFPRIRKNELLYRGVPYGTLCLNNESGYMKSDTFVEFLQHFQKHTQSTVVKKVLLILDGHSSHKSLAAIEFCRANGIILLSLPPHCTHEMQPLDVAVFAPLQAYYNQQLNLWLKANPGKIVTLYNVGDLFGKAYRQAATLDNGLSGFEKTGIQPFNPTVLADWRFKPSLTTDRPMLAQVNENVIPERERTPSPQPNELRFGSQMATRKKNRTAKYDSSSESEDLEEWESSGRSSDDIKSLENDTETNEKSPIVKAQTSLTKQFSENKFVTPFEIRPLPLAPIQTRSSRRSKGATVITSTPNYNETKEKCTNSKPKTSLKAKDRVKKSLSLKSNVNNKSQESTDKENDSDVPCIFCCELYSTSAAKEYWIRCNSCHKWAHALCAGVSASKKAYNCDLCA